MIRQHNTGYSSRVKANSGSRRREHEQRSRPANRRPSGARNGRSTRRLLDRSKLTSALTLLGLPVPQATARCLAACALEKLAPTDAPQCGLAWTCGACSCLREWELVTSRPPSSACLTRSSAGSSAPSLQQQYGAGSLTVSCDFDGNEYIDCRSANRRARPPLLQDAGGESGLASPSTSRAGQAVSYLKQYRRDWGGNRELARLCWSSITFSKVESVLLAHLNKIKVSGRLSGKWRSREPIQALWALACARVLPGHAA
jgi:hypothetical protein